jgi:hypothetical protein
MLTVLRHGVTEPLSHCFLATGRSCITHLIRKFSPDRVFLPSFVPEGLVFPFKAENVPITFYPLKINLEPDVGNVERQIAVWRPARPIIVLLNYFGYAMESYALAAIAHKYGGILMADNAHSLMNPSVENDCADVTLYSLNKFLPVTDGALMFSRTPQVDVSIEKPKESDSLAIDAYRAHMIANRIVANAPNGAAAALALEQSAAAYDDYYDRIVSDMEPRKVSDRASAAFARLDIDEMRSVRTSNAKHITGLLASEQQIVHDGTPLFAFPIWVKNRERATALLSELGVCPAYLGAKWDVYGPSPNAARDFAVGHILLPLHERLPPTVTWKILKSL